jgi:monofunctional chorismate mutase
MDKLAELRKEIDQLDDKIMELLDERFEITKQVGLLKKESNTNILDKKRETIILDKTSKYSHYPQILSVYQFIMNLSKEKQREL